MREALQLLAPEESAYLEAEFVKFKRNHGMARDLLKDATPVSREFVKSSRVHSDLVDTIGVLRRARRESSFASLGSSGSSA